MSTISWNCRGLGTPGAVQFLKEVVLQKHPKFIFLCEILCKRNKVESVAKLLGIEGFFIVESQGHSGGIALSVWGREITGCFKDRIKHSQKSIKALKGRRDVDYVRVYQEELKKLAEIYVQQEVFWKQRSKQI